MTHAQNYLGEEIGEANQLLILSIVCNICELNIAAAYSTSHRSLLFRGLAYE